MITEGEKDKQVLHKLPLKNLKFPAIKETDQVFGISLSSQLL